MRINLIEILLSLPAVFLAITFHEFAHAYSAHRLERSYPKTLAGLLLTLWLMWIGLVLLCLLCLVLDGQNRCS